AISFIRSNAGMENETLLSSPMLAIPVAVFGVQRKLELTGNEERELLHWVLLADALGHYSVSSETILDRDLAVLFKGQGASALTSLLRQQHGKTRFDASDFAGRG